MDSTQSSLFTSNAYDSKARNREEEKVSRKSGSELFSKAVLKEAIELMPTLPDTDSIDDVRQFLLTNLHYSSEETRQRHGNYIMRRMFPDGRADSALRLFAKTYSGRQELRDVCFYRFVKAEHLMVNVVDDLLLPSIGTGLLVRKHLSEYLRRRNPNARNIKDCSQAISQAFAAGNIAQVGPTEIRFGYREILLPSYAFVLYSEFSEPGMYRISDLENNDAVRAMLWSPDRLLPASYELRNRRLVAKISEIDNVRQFTTNLTLDDVVERLSSEDSGK